ncbi:hypothetical protein OIU76_015990 [Salix suchowensis]|nr:hypothetical protein OIU76_015990 [Salix suchowensis]
MKKDFAVRENSTFWRGNSIAKILEILCVYEIAARMYEKNEISRIWCEWLGKKGSNDDDKVRVLDYDFGVVTFAYDYELGKSGLFDDMKLSLSSSAAALTENDEGV